MAFSGSDINVREVYNLAYEIAQDFESIVDSSELVDITPFVKKLIHVFEILEDVVKKIDSFEKEISDLKNETFQLLSEKTTQREENFRLKEAIDEKEESWFKESVFLRSFIDKLKTQNRLLQKNISLEELEDHEGVVQYEQIIQQQENLIIRLKSSLKQKDSRLDFHVETIEKLNFKLDQAKELNKSLHEKLIAAQCLFDANIIEQNISEKMLFEQKIQLSTLEKSFSDLQGSFPSKDERKATVQNASSHVENFLQQQQCFHEKNLNLQKQMVLLQNENKKFKDRLTVLERESQTTETKSVIHSIFRLFLGTVYVRPQIW